MQNVKRRTIFLLAVASFSFSQAKAQRSSSNADVRGIGIAPVALGYRGPCPVTIRFAATVYFTHVPISVRYYWERDRERTKVQLAKLSVHDPPKFNANTEWAVGTPGKKFNATARLHVFTDAGEIVSETKESTGDCVR